MFGQNDNVEFGYISDQTIECWDNVLGNGLDVANPLADGVWGLVAVTSEVASPPREDAAYVTTPRFLELFGLQSLDDLPRTDDLQLL